MTGSFPPPLRLAAREYGCSEDRIQLLDLHDRAGGYPSANGVDGGELGWVARTSTSSLPQPCR
jgi:hypothetical protein